MQSCVAGAHADNSNSDTTTTISFIAIQQGLNRPDRATTLPKELEEFTTSTERLCSLREHLTNDIREYETTSQEHLALFDNERALINDPITTRSMATLRRHTEEDANDRVTNARATLEQLSTVLTKGADLQHAARCVLLAETFHEQGTTLDTSLRTAKEQATLYASVTNGLLARINNALTE